LENQEILLQLSDLESSPTALLAVTRELANRLSNEPDMKVSLPEAPTSKGSKGDPITIGALVLSIVGSRGALSSLIGLLKAYIERRPTLAFEFRRGDSKITVRAENLTSRELGKTSEALRRLMEAGS
jgi:hypothetical protein